MTLSSKTPMIDIVMLVSQQATWSDLAIRAVEHHTAHPYRLILVDQAVKDPAVKAVIDGAEERGHTVVRMAEDRSFSNGNNAGIRAGDAKIVVILNDDALVTEGWDKSFVQDLADKSVGLVGARTNYGGGVQADMTFQGEPPFHVFICVGFRRELFNVIGPMDEENFTAYSSEDLDYSWRFRKAGYKLKLSGYVLHAGSRSIMRHVSGGSKDPAVVQGSYNAMNAKFNRVLEEKWGKEWVKANSVTRKRVCVASYHAEEWTRVKFLGAFVGLKRSDGYTFEFYNHTRAPIHAARQAMCDYATDNGFDCLVQLDDDAVFPPDVVRRLLNHDKEIVTALAYQRRPPHWPCIFELGPEGLLGAPLEGWERTGLRRVDVSGFHCSMIKTSVIRKMREGLKDAQGNVTVPGTRQYFGGFENKVGEDFAFSLNAKKYGIQLHCDTDLISGHIGDAIVVDEAYRAQWKAQQAAK